MASNEKPNNEVVENLIETSVTENAVIVVNIKYATISMDGRLSRKKNLPNSFVLDLPERITQFEDKQSQKYTDMIETFVFNTLTKKFQTEVNFCQIYLG